MAETRRSLSGWGRADRRSARVQAPGPHDDLRQALLSLPGPVTVRGAGRSYGDAALPEMDGGSVLDLTRRDAVLDFDRRTGVVVVQSGTSLAALQDLGLPHGWSVPVMPGTAAVTVGGAVASDVHGKNQPGAGTFGRHVQWLDLMCGEGDSRRLSPEGSREDDPEGFWATVGGMGLTGVIDVVALQLTRVGSDLMWHRRSRTADLASTMWLMDSVAGRQSIEPLLHNVAWIDASVEGPALGRAVVDTYRHADAGDLPHRRSLRQNGSSRLGRDVRALPGAGVVSRLSVRAGAGAHWHTAGRSRETLVAVRRGLTPMDAAPWWPAAFGLEGLVQYQLGLPLTGSDQIEVILRLLLRLGVPPALAVLKRFTDGALAPLAFAVEGWSLALDFPRRWPLLEPALRAVDGIVADHGGRVYLTKDSRLPAHAMSRMYPLLESWRTDRDRLDPSRRMTSSLGARVGLVDSARHTMA
ncbi:FAD-binding protein [Angustibacter sp. McL0619]|uniref:FAD-binding oxidoreductase n=1 Tax=Angustibacter sp. McL0619 TaxID=3415676 RepID=UPI003CEFE3D5